MELYPEQKAMVETIWRAFASGEQRVLAVAPTAGGKTEMMRELIKKANTQTLVLCGKKELASQLVKRLNADGVYSASLEEKTWGAVTVGTVESVARAKVVPLLKLVIIDEAHNLGDAEESAYQRALALCPTARVLGFTATPFGIYGPSKYWPRIHSRITLDEMWELKRIVKPIMAASREQFDTSGLHLRMGDYVAEELERLTCDEAKIKKQVADALPRLSGRQKCVWACTSIVHAEMVRSEIRDAVCVHSKQDKETRENSLREFEHGAVRHLVFVTIVSEGYNYPAIDAIIFMRPTRSARLYVQTVGRGLRLHDGKENCLVLDYGRVVEALGPINNPTLLTGRKGKAEKADISLWLCEKCYGYNELPKAECFHCGATPEPVEKTKNLTHKAGTGDLIGKAHTVRVDGVQLSKHISKNGNVCIKIAYDSGTLIKQYFYEWVMPWNFAQYKERLSMFGAPDTFEQCVEYVMGSEHTNTDLFLEWSEDGKYKKVRKVYRA
jgi:DNA repair protein RadD